MQLRSLGLALAAALGLAGCSAPDVEELAAQHPWQRAREDARFVEVKDLRMWALTAGKGTDVVLVHGNPASLRTWKHVFDPLAEHYRVHAIDLPGFGFSDKPAGSYEDAWLAEALIDYLNSQEIHSAVLVGNSMGGHIATEAAMLHPGRVDALVLIGGSGLPLPGGEPAEEEREPFIVSLLRLPGMEALVRLLPTEGVLREELALAYYDPAQLDDAELAEWGTPLTTRGGMTAFLARSTRHAGPEREERVRGIDAPTLILHGDTDRLVPLAIGERYHELIPLSELVIMQETGHLPQEERPDDVVREIRRFLDAKG